MRKNILNISDSRQMPIRKEKTCTQCENCSQTNEKQFQLKVKKNFAVLETSDILMHGQRTHRTSKKKMYTRKNEEECERRRSKEKSHEEQPNQWIVYFWATKNWRLNEYSCTIFNLLPLKAHFRVLRKTFSISLSLNFICASPPSQRSSPLYGAHHANKSERANEREIERERARG